MRGVFVITCLFVGAALVVQAGTPPLSKPQAATHQPASRRRPPRVVPARIFEALGERRRKRPQTTPESRLLKATR